MLLWYRDWDVETERRWEEGRTLAASLRHNNHHITSRPPHTTPTLQHNARTTRLNHAHLNVGQLSVLHLYQYHPYINISATLFLSNLKTRETVQSIFVPGIDSNPMFIRQEILTVKIAFRYSKIQGIFPTPGDGPISQFSNLHTQSISWHFHSCGLLDPAKEVYQCPHSLRRGWVRSSSLPPSPWRCPT